MANEIREWRQGEFTISTDEERLDFKVIHNFLSTESYWAIGRPMEVIKRSVENSLPFGLYKGEEQVGFARVITDYATFAWLADVFVLDSERGKGLGKWLVEIIVSHPELQGLRRWVLATKDAHELYSRVGFTDLIQPQRWMEKFKEHPLVTSDYQLNGRTPETEENQ